MFADQTLTPKEAIRLCALGTLLAEPLRYDALAIAIRHFISRIAGPTPEIMGHSIELLKYEGLVTAVDGDGDEALLAITAAGRAEMHRLLTARVRPANTELNHLVIALKFRFLHTLSPAEQGAQADALIDACEQELVRLEDLRRHHAGDAGHLIDWLDHDIEGLRQRIGWLAAFRDRVAGAAAAGTLAAR